MTASGTLQSEICIFLRLCKAGRIGDSIPEDSQQEIIMAEFPQVIVMIITIHQDSMIGDSFVIHQLSIIEETGMVSGDSTVRSSRMGVFQNVPV